MLQSALFTKTRKEAPRDEVARNARLLIRAGFIDKLQAGVYTYLPLGFRVLKKVEDVIRRHMNALGAQELLMPSLHPKELWEKTGRWRAMGDLYKITDAGGRENALAGTHEEVVVPTVGQFVSSYKELPFSVYQIQNKFRMELRAKSGILRGREFIMKDLYSFHRSEADLEAFYNSAKKAYKAIFGEAGIGAQTIETFASGGSFSQYSHEFQTVTDAGEDIIHICRKCRLAVNDEIISEQNTCPSCGGELDAREKSIEVGNIFMLKTKFTEPFGFTVKNERGEEEPVLMGCYGIGLGRLIGAVSEVLSDERGLYWPENIAPFRYHLIEVQSSDPAVRRYANDVYHELENAGVEVLYDDRPVSVGEKFADADLIGIPTRLVVSEKSVERGGVEVKRRNEEKTRIVAREELVNS